MAKLSQRQVELLQRPNVAIVATIRRDGTPHLTPTWVDTDGEHVLINTVEGRAKARNLRRDPRVSLCVVDRDDQYSWVAVTGTAELTHEGADEHLRELSRKYGIGADDWPASRRAILVTITPERVSP
jgi:PPOX class probable F420-dependent enzyme